MSIYLRAINRHSSMAWPGRTGLYLALTREVALALEKLRSGKHPVPDALREAGIWIERRSAIETVVPQAIRAKIGLGDTSFGPLELVTKLPRFGTKSVPASVQVEGICPASGRWIFTDARGRHINELGPFDLFTGLLFSANREDRAFAIRRLAAANPFLLFDYLDTDTPLEHPILLDGRPTLPPLVCATAEELSPLLDSPNREVRQRARLLVGEAMIRGRKPLRSL